MKDMLASPPRPTAAAANATAAAVRPFISVVVPVRNEEAFIGRTLQQLVAQDYPADRFEVLVADGGSRDATPEIVQEFQAAHAQVHLLENPGRWSSAGRNAAIRASRGELIVIVDGHCELDNDRYLAELAGAFAESGAACVGRPQPLEVPGASRLQQAIAVARASRLGHHPDSHIYSRRAGFVPPQSVAVAYRAEVFDLVGLFDESFDACEDVEFNHRVDRAGLRCYFTPGVQVRYYPRTSLSGLFRQMLRYGRGRVRLCRKHPETFTVPGFVPAVFLAGLVAGPVLACCSSWLAGAYLAGLGLYGLIVLGFSTALALGCRQPQLAAWLPLVFAAIHLGAGAGQWWELLAPARPDRLEPDKTGDRVPAQPRRQPVVREPRTAGVVNALTIDVEDYYHVSAFERIVSRRGWEDFEPCGPPSSSWAGWADGSRSWCGPSAPPVTRSAATATNTASSTSRRRRPFAQTCAAGGRSWRMSWASRSWPIARRAFRSPRDRCGRSTC
jgi:succinoglycan biosynthesis protein ExoA